MQEASRALLALSSLDLKALRKWISSTRRWSTEFVHREGRARECILYPPPAVCQNRRWAAGARADPGLAWVRGLLGTMSFRTRTTTAQKLSRLVLFHPRISGQTDFSRKVFLIESRGLRSITRFPNTHCAGRQWLHLCHRNRARPSSLGCAQVPAAPWTETRGRRATARAIHAAALRCLGKENTGSSIFGHGQQTRLGRSEVLLGAVLSLF